jgi:DNA replication licensing factor MCM4
MARTNVRQLNLDCQNLLAYRPSMKLHSLIIDYPAEVLPLLDFALNEFFDEHHPEVDMKGDSLMASGEPWQIKRWTSARAKEA